MTALMTGIAVKKTIHPTGSLDFGFSGLGNFIFRILSNSSKGVLYLLV
jgi:hypothetical protein